MNKKPILFQDAGSDSDVEIKTNNDYATHYDKWRQKEEMNKLKTKYGDHALSKEISDDSSSEDDEDAEELTQNFEKDFFKTLSCLKNKDPKIYDENVVFFEETPITEKKKSKKNEPPMFLKDYERKMILEKGAKFEDSEDEDDYENPRANSPTYVEQQQKLKESLKTALNDEENDDEQWGGLFSKRDKTKEEKDMEDEDYKKWLKGAKDQLDDKEEETALKPLKEYWNKPDLDKTEKFLRDYLLNKRYRENEDKNHIPTYDEIVHDSDDGLSEDEEQIEKQEEFEHKYNFRFEEPDQDFIKRYPRTLEQSVRKTDDRRKIKRLEIRERKEEEKKQKQEELKQLKAYKRKEIEEKIQMLKEITGNEEMAFQNADFDEDFNPEEHDKRMQELFNDQYYEGEEGDQKPEFSDLDEELGPWKDSNEPHCEDDDFNMDADYDPNAPSTSQKTSKKDKKKRNRPGKQSKNKDEGDDLPIDENDERYEEYMDELYKLDYEDMIGDLPCRFKYRDVLPNDFGLTVEEILLAKDKELNSWCSLKKTMQYRPEHMERYDLLTYKRKAMNDEVKKKLLPSIYDETLLEEDPMKEEQAVKMNKHKNFAAFETQEHEEINKKQNVQIIQQEPEEIIEEKKIIDNEEPEQIEEPTTKKKKKKQKTKKISSTIKKPKKNDIKTKINITENNNEEMLNKEKKDGLSRRQRKNIRKVLSKPNENTKTTKPIKQNRKRKLSTQDGAKNNPKKKQKLNKSNNKEESNILLKMSDARLEAYGLNPKKFKNKLKYQNKNNKKGTK